MQPTRRTGTAAAVGGALAVIAPAVGSPVPAIGAALVFGWLIARQIATVRAFQTTVDATTVTVEPAVTAVGVDTELPVTLTVERPPVAADTTLTISLPVPVAAKRVGGASREVRLDVGETRAETTVVFGMPTAGRIGFPEPTWELADSQTAFTESFARGPTPTVNVSARELQNLHVGRGGTELSAFGQHATDSTGDGITPAELRQYLSGDPADRIDWKATARLAEPYVREFEAESDREITLIVDHRSRTGEGSATDTPLAYLREVALGIAENAASTGDPLGLVTVGDEGLTHTVDATRQQIGYTRIRERLVALEPTPAGTPTSGVDLQHPAATRRLSQQLAGDESRFGTVLRAFTETTPAYVERIERDPLYGAVDYLRTASSASQLTIILTTDADRPQLRETVRAAASGESAVLVFLTPQVLFDGGELANLEAAYRRYREFEEFRTELERFGPVVAHEVGPGDRLATLLSSTQARRAGRRTASGGSD